ncbi:MAG: DUF262 domain-containing protein [Actinomycetota bacterium]
MDIVPVKVTVRDLTKDYVDNAEQGVAAYGGKLDVRPPYQREFVYKDDQRDAVIDTITKGYPLNTMYWAVRDDGTFEVMDGQQRTISIGQYVTGDFTVDGRGFNNLQDDERARILDYELTVYQCEGKDSEKLDWFRTINIAGVELSDQELRNAVYHGSWVTDAKKRFSKRGCPAYGIARDYLSGEMNRQKWLETAIKWINDGKVEEYMAVHQHDPTAIDLWNYFASVIEWVKTTFPTVHREMKGLSWGPLYSKYSSTKFDPSAMDADVRRLRADSQVENNKGIYEYLLSGKTDTRLLSIRVFDDKTKAARYQQQTTIAEEAGPSNCPLCAVGNNANRTRIYAQDEMDADHVTAWSKGGNTDLKNCQMLCVTHNRAKGNR